MSEECEVTHRSVRVRAVLAGVATVPILAVCGQLVRVLPQLDPLGHGEADGEIIWPIMVGLITLALFAGVLRAPQRGAGCFFAALLILAVPSTMYLLAILSQ